MSSIYSAYLYPSSVADSELERRVAAYLATRNFLSFQRLHVLASQGVVVLSGNLSSFHQRQVAVESARRVAGVTQVIDRLVVETVSRRLPSVPRFAAAGELLRAVETRFVAERA